MSLLFEYGKWEKADAINDLKLFLHHIWEQRPVDQKQTDLHEASDDKYQSFVRFDGDKIRAKNYVGFIQNGNELIEIYPKVFKEARPLDSALMLRHIFYWMSYCRKWKFPFTQSSLKPNDIDKFPELIIHLIATQFCETVSEQPFMQYRLHEEALDTPRGTINFTRYINQAVTKGIFHKLECDHEPFMFDNKVNRIIKYCTRLLLSKTRLSENQKLLQETLFILDEVEDIICTANEIDSITLNSFYLDYTSLMSVCKTIVEQQIYSSDSFELNQWCLLLPMEYVFEDFIAGFIKTHFSNEWDVWYQKSDEWLTSNPSVFQMQHDIFLVSRGTKRTLIIDTKYKLRKYDEGDNKAGVMQSDLYQMISYAFRRGCSEALILYPNMAEQPRPFDSFKVHSGFDNQIIHVTVAEIPFWSMANFSSIEQNLRDALKILLLRRPCENSSSTTSAQST